MKKKLIKKGEIIFGDYFDKHILHDSIILHKTNLNCLIRNNFIRTFFTFAHSLNEIEENIFGITYKRNSITFMHQLLEYISNSINEEDYIIINNKRYEFKLIVLNERVIYGNYNEMFRIQLNDNNLFYNEKYNIAEKINEKIILFLINNKDFINDWINSCLNGEIPLLKETINIYNNEELPYFSYDLELFFNNDNNLSLGHNLSFENIYNLEIFSDFIRERESNINRINVLLNDENMTPSTFLNSRYFVKFDSFLKQMKISKTLCIPKEINLVRNFNDENAVFKIDSKYDLFSGNISVDTFFDIRNKLSSEELTNFAKSLRHL